MVADMLKVTRDHCALVVEKGRRSSDLNATLVIESGVLDCEN
jgi:hypothetical protein